MLIQAGADVEAHHCDDYTPLAVAINSNHRAAAELLFDKGARMSSVSKDLRIPD